MLVSVLRVKLDNGLRNFKFSILLPSPIKNETYIEGHLERPIPLQNYYITYPKNIRIAFYYAFSEGFI